MYDELKAKIVEAVPEIMAIKLGCKIFIPGEEVYTMRGKRGNGIIISSHIGEARSWSGYDPTTDRVSAIMSSGVVRPMFGIKKNKVEILGRDITLEDILLTSNFDLRVGRVGRDGAKTGRFERWDGHDWDRTVDWEFGQPLHAQSDETITFLHSILCR